MMDKTSVLEFATLGAALVLAPIACSTAGAGQPPYAYTTTVTLPSGLTAECAVNEPLAGTARPAAQPLTATEARQAEVLATRRLWLDAGPRSDYPTPYTAPVVHRRVAP